MQIGKFFRVYCYLHSGTGLHDVYTTLYACSPVYSREQGMSLVRALFCRQVQVSLIFMLVKDRMVGLKNGWLVS